MFIGIYVCKAAEGLLSYVKHLTDQKEVENLQTAEDELLQAIFHGQLVDCLFFQLSAHSVIQSLMNLSTPPIQHPL